MNTIVNSVFLNLGAFFCRPSDGKKTGLSGVPLRSILCASRKERFAPLQSLARPKG
jgi:hypothetical protein